MRCNQIPDELRAAITEMWAAGASATEIGAAIGRTRSSVLGFANRNRGLCPLRLPGGWYGKRGQDAKPETNRIRAARANAVARVKRGLIAAAVNPPIVKSRQVASGKAALYRMLAEAAANTAALKS